MQQRYFVVAGLVLACMATVARAQFTPISSGIGPDVTSLYALAAQKLTATDSSVASDLQPDVIWSGQTQWSSAWANWWTSGFYPGQLWMMYRQTGEDAWLAKAKIRTAVQVGQEYNDCDHDVGFRVFCSFGQGYASLPDTDPLKANYKTRILTAATTLAGRYNPTYRAIESWDGNRVIIDNMMNLELLFWAAANGASNATQLYNIAVAHAQTSRAQHVRADGSTYHVVRFDGNTGAVLSRYTSQGLADESTWSRGQAWAIHGFTTTYRYTGDQQYLDTAVAAAEYWLANLPADGIPLYDFDCPDTSLKDTSAAAVAASGLLELMQYVDPADGQRYFDTAEAMLAALGDLALSTDGSYAALLPDGSKAADQHDMGLIYGDYYFLEALERYEAAAATTPEPATLGMLAIGSLALLRRRSARRRT